MTPDEAVVALRFLEETRREDRYGVPVTLDEIHAIRVLLAERERLREALDDIGKAPCMRALLGEGSDDPCWCPSCRAFAALAGKARP